jgi:hypothetical protein
MSDFTPHGFCLAWDPELLWLTVLGHAATACAYFGIPITMIASIRQIRMVPAWLLAMFALFILLCGVSHVMEIVALWVPVYWGLAIEVMMTAVTSMATLYFLPLGIIQMLERQRVEDD